MDADHVESVLQASARAGEAMTYGEVLNAASDGLPGQGWWLGGRPRSDGFAGPWEGPEAAAYIARVQQQSFSYWRVR